MESFNARVLAADPGDVGYVAVLRKKLEEILASLEFSPSQAEALRLAVSGLQLVEEGRSADASAVMDNIAAVVAALARSASTGSATDSSELAAAADSLRGLLVPGSVARSAVVVEAARQGTSGPAVGPATTFMDNTFMLPPDSDPDILKEFIAESCDRIAEAEACLLILEKDPKAPEQINTVLRAFHSIKGASGFLALEEIRKLAHLAENLLARARENEIELTGANADLALRSCDILKTMIQSLGGVEPGSSVPLPDGLAELAQGLAQEKKSPGGRGAAPAPTPVAGPQADALPPSDNETAPDDARQEAAAQACDAGPATPAAESDAPERAAPAQQAATGPAQEAAVRVSTGRLDDLVNMVGELVIAHALVAQHPDVAKNPANQLSQNIAHAGKIVRDLQSLAMTLRMVPLKGTFQKMSRLVRDLERHSGKHVRFVAVGENTEIDRNMVEVLNDPLVHMIRNAMDHGIEPPEERARCGKDAVGTLHLRAYHAAGNVVIELQDDGQGLRAEKILDKAIERGLAEPGSSLSEAEIYSLIFQPGFSTADKVTDVSGRGVGLDVVKKNMDALRGRVEVRSRPGAGTTFTLHVPLTMAIVDAILLRAGKERYLLPTVSIHHSFRPGNSEISTVTGRGEMVKFQDEMLPLFRLHRMFDIPDAATDPLQALLIIIEGHGRRCALMVDELLGQQQTVIKSLGKSLAKVPGVSGGAILGDGRVGLILDAADLVELAQGQKTDAV